MSDILVEVESISKKFCRNLKRSLLYGVFDIGSDLIGIDGARIGLRKQEFWANRDLSFQLKRGESLGIIGKNGAGKTTLLKMLNGLIRPDRGKISVQGQTGALIALGAGFNPILTGRENIRINASILGLSERQIRQQIDDIIEFSELEDFIDTPLQSYSSGMAVRLGFAVATAINPDILILDEVLAVGDAAFRTKCFNRIGRIRESTAIFFVSHSAAQVSLVCDSVLYLKKGQTAFCGDCLEGLEFYADDNRDSHNADTSEATLLPEIQSASLQIKTPEVKSSDELEFTATVISKVELADVAVRLMFWDVRQMPLADWYSKRYGIPITLQPGTNTFNIKLGPLHLKPAEYNVSLVVESKNSITRYVDVINAVNFRVTGKTYGGMLLYAENHGFEHTHRK